MAAHDDQISMDKSVQPQVQYRDYLCDPCHPVQERFTCGICYNLMEKPRLLDCCGSIYCATCLDKAFKRHWHQKCPHCRATTTFVEDKGMEREIKSFRIRCPYFMNGCKWSGELHHFMAFRKHSEICERKLVSIIKAMPEANLETHQKCIPLNVSATSSFYDNHSYDFEEKIHDRYICSICCELMKDPQLMVCCGFYCCSICLEKWLLQKLLNCPFCPCSALNYVVHKYVQREIQNLKVLCTNQRRGCEWIGELRDVRNHLNKKCEHNEISCIHCNEVVIVKEYQSHESSCQELPVECPNKCGQTGITRRILSVHRSQCKLEMVSCSRKTLGCKARVKRQDIQDHLDNSCKFTPTKCEYCGKKTNMKEYNTSHINVCVKYPVMCPNGCGESELIRQTLYSHSGACRLELIECKYFDRGCRELVRRQDMRDHLKSSCKYMKSCRYCNEIVTIKEHASHEGNCKPVECPNKCGQTGLIQGTLSTHISQCKVHIVSCTKTYLGCKERMKRHDLHHHLAVECKFTPINCEYCGESIHTKEYYYSSHIKLCYKFPISCPNGCGQPGLVRQMLNSHKKTCKFELIACKYSKKGCNDSVRRQDMDDHLRTSCKLTRICTHCDKIFTMTGYVFHEEKCPELPMNCPNNCGQSGIVRRTFSEHRSQCKLKLVPCSREDWGCEVKVKRQDLQHHLDYICRIVLMTCEYCGEIYSRDYNTNHINICTKFPVACPNGCGKPGLVRQALDSHRKACELEMIKCIHPSGSCHEMVRRLNMFNHLETSCKKTVTHCPRCGLHWSTLFMQRYAPLVENIFKKYLNFCLYRSIIEHIKLNPDCTSELFPKHKALNRLIDLKNQIIDLSSITEEIIDEMEEHYWKDSQLVAKATSLYVCLQEYTRIIKKEIEISKIQSDKENLILIAFGAFVVIVLGICFYMYWMK